MGKVTRLCMLALVAAAPALAEPASTPPPEIPSVGSGGILHWRQDGDTALTIESSLHHFYRATFSARCFKKPFQNDIVFLPAANDTLDRHGAIEFNGHRCFFETFQEIPRPANW